MDTDGKIQRVAIIDDHELIRQGLTLAFERQPDFAVVGAVGTCLL